MKTIDTEYIETTVGMPIKSGTLNHLQQAYQEALFALARTQIGNYNANTVYVLYGCIEGSTTVSPGNGAQIIMETISEGAVYYNGDIYISPYAQFVPIGQVGDTTVAKINTSNFNDPTADPVIFTNGVGHNVHKIETFTYGIAPSGSGVANFADFVYPFSWSSAGLALGTIPGGAAWTNVGGYNVAYKVCGTTVSLCGTITNNIPAPGTFTLLTLPPVARPAAQVILWVNVNSGSGLSTTVNQYGLSVNTNGQIILNTANMGTFTINLDGMNFRLV